MIPYILYLVGVLIALASLFLVTKKKKKRTTRKYTSISVMQIGHYAAQYSNLTGTPLGTVADALTKSILQNGQDDILALVIAQVNAGLANVTQNPFKVAIKAAAIAFLFRELRRAVGRTKIFQVGRFRITS